MACEPKLSLYLRHLDIINFLLTHVMLLVQSRTSENIGWLLKNWFLRGDWLQSNENIHLFECTDNGQLAHFCCSWYISPIWKKNEKMHMHLGNDVKKIG